MQQQEEATQRPTLATAKSALDGRHALDHVFSYHAPDAAQVEHYTAIRDGAHNLAATIIDHCPPSADRTVALRCIREAVMNANASVALNGQPY